MTTKPAFPFWTIVKRSGNPYEIMKVTSEKTSGAGWRHHYFGSIGGFSSHCRAAEATGRFTTEAEAQAAFDGVAKIRAKWRVEKDRIDKLFGDVHDAEKAEIESFLKSGGRS